MLLPLPSRSGAADLLCVNSMPRFPSALLGSTQLPIAALRPSERGDDTSRQDVRICGSDGGGMRHKPANGQLPGAGWKLRGAALAEMSSCVNQHSTVRRWGPFIFIRSSLW